MLKFNKTELLDKIKDFISTLKEETPAKIEDQETKLEQATLEDGTILEFTSLEEGEAIFVVLEGGNEPLGSGEYLIGDKLVIVADGIISNVTDKDVEVVEESKSNIKDIKIQKLAKVIEINKWVLEVENADFKLNDIVLIRYDESSEPVPINDGEYLLEDGRKIQIDSDGKIVLVTEAEAVEAVEAEAVEAEVKVEASKEPDKPKEEVSKEPDKPKHFSAEDFNKKVKEIEDEYNVKLEKEKEKIKEGLDKLTLEVKESVIVQAPIEGKSKSKPLSTKEIMIDLINNKVKL